MMVLRISILLFLFVNSLQAQNRNDVFSERIDERRNMVYRDIANYRGIAVTDEKVLDAMFKVPRHCFVTENFQQYAYENSPLPIGFNQTISQPVIVASMTQILDIEPGMKVLEVGTGSGYQAAILAELGCEVYSIEIVEELANRAEKTLRQLGYNNVSVKHGDGYAGWIENAPFDRIIVTCAPENVPDPLKEQLAKGGKIVIPVGRENEIQFLHVIRKSESGELINEIKYAVRFVPMTGKAQQE